MDVDFSWSDTENEVNHSGINIWLFPRDYGFSNIDHPGLLGRFQEQPLTRNISLSDHSTIFFDTSSRKQAREICPYCGQ